MSKKIEIDQDKISRIEVINHGDNGHQIGRLLVLHKSMGDFDGLEIQVQDSGKTLKIFLDTYRTKEEDV